MKKATLHLIFFLLILAQSGCQKSPPKIIVAGSRSVLPVMQEVADKYSEENPDVIIEIQGIGTSAGIEAANNGVADIGMSSRDLKPEESENLEPIIIGYDVVAIITNPINPISDLSTEQVRLIFSGQINNWGEFGWEDRPITIIDKEAGSGTKEVFEELLMGETPISKTAIIMDGTAAARQAVADDPNAIGYISLASVDESVKFVFLDGSAPSIENIFAGKYSLLRPFVLVIIKGNENELITNFIGFVVSDDGQKIIEDAGLIPIK